MQKKIISKANITQIVIPSSQVSVIHTLRHKRGKRRKMKMCLLISESIKSIVKVMVIIIATVKSVQLQLRDNKVGCSNELVVHITLLLLPGHLIINNLITIIIIKMKKV